MEKRSEAEMMELILSFAREDPRVRAVWMNGSRANPHAKRDEWQDFDIVYAVTDMDSFLADDRWLDRFGERIVMQSSREQLDRYDPNGKLLYEDWFIAMMQFADGNRIDLSLVPVSHASEKVQSDRMCVILLDKDGSLPEIPPSTDAEYRTVSPSPLEFSCCVNEVHWVAPYVAKGLWRKEIPYAQEMLGIVRKQVIKIFGWKAAIERGESVNIGKSGKYLAEFLTPGEWKRFLSGYPDGEAAHILQALLQLYDLFGETAEFVAGHMGYPYPKQECERVREYLLREGRM